MPCIRPFTIAFISIVAAFTASSQSYMENLTRGLVAVKTREGYFLSWRLLGHEDYSTAFNVYKGDTKLNDTPIENATCSEDKSAGNGDYSVRAVVNGNELTPSEADLVLSIEHFFGIFPECFEMRLFQYEHSCLC